MDWLTMSLGLGGGGIVMFVLKKIPNDKICAFIEGSFEKLGALMTCGLSKWQWTKKAWNKTVEPWAIDLIDNIFGSMVRGLIKGLRSDN